MRTFITLFLFFVLFTTQALAQPPAYANERRMIEKQNSKDTTPTTERLFVSDNLTSGFIVRYRDGITLREIINKTKNHDDEDLSVLVFRQDKQEPTFAIIVHPSDKPLFALKPEDVIVVLTHPVVF